MLKHARARMHTQTHAHETHFLYPPTLPLPSTTLHYPHISEGTMSWVSGGARPVLPMPPVILAYLLRWCAGVLVRWRVHNWSDTTMHATLHANVACTPNSGHSASLRFRLTG